MELCNDLKRWKHDKPNPDYNPELNCDNQHLCDLAEAVIWQARQDAESTITSSSRGFQVVNQAHDAIEFLTTPSEELSFWVDRVLGMEVKDFLKMSNRRKPYWIELRQKNDPIILFAHRMYIINQCLDRKLKRTNAKLSRSINKTIGRQEVIE